MNGRSVSVPRVPAVKNSRTDPNSRIVAKSSEGDCARLSERIPTTRLISSRCTLSSMARPPPSISRERASFSSPSRRMASPAPSASTQSVAML